MIDFVKHSQTCIFFRWIYWITHITPPGWPSWLETSCKICVLIFLFYRLCLIILVSKSYRLYLSSLVPNSSLYFSIVTLTRCWRQPRTLVSVLGSFVGSGSHTKSTWIWWRRNSVVCSGRMRTWKRLYGGFGPWTQIKRNKFLPLKLRHFSVMTCSNFATINR